MIIRYENIVLREWGKSDAERLVEICNNKKIYDNVRDRFPHPYTINDARWFIENFLSIGLERAFAVVVDGVVVGNISGAMKDDVYSQNVEIGYFLDEKYWGRGIITKAVKALIKHFFEEYNITRIYAEMFAENTASRRVMEKAGFKLEAVLKKNVIKNGILGDNCIYSILREDFENPNLKEMRRKEKKITDMEMIEEVLDNSEIVRLAMCDGCKPYIVAMNYVYTEECIYVHSAKQGRKMNILKVNNLVSFQLDIETELVINENACNCGMKYKSVYGEGKSIFVEQKEEKIRVLDALMKKYTGKSEFEYPEKMLDATSIIKIEIESITGKKSGF